MKLYENPDPMMRSVLISEEIRQKFLGTKESFA